MSNAAEGSPLGTDSSNPRVAPYTQQELVQIDRIAEAARQAFPICSTRTGTIKFWDFLEDLKDELNSFGRENGFTVRTQGAQLVCSKAHTTPSMQKRLSEKKKAKTPEDNQNSIPVGCAFRVGYKRVQYLSKSHPMANAPPGAVVITGAYYRHTNGCLSCASTKKRAVASLSGTSVPVPRSRSKQNSGTHFGTLVDRGDVDGDPPLQVRREVVVGDNNARVNSERDLEIQKEGVKNSRILSKKELEIKERVAKAEVKKLEAEAAKYEAEAKAAQNQSAVEARATHNRLMFDLLKQRKELKDMGVAQEEIDVALPLPWPAV